MWYKHKHRKKAHRTEHRIGGSRAVLTQTSAAPGGMIHLLPRIQSYLILGPVLCLFKPLWLSRKEDQSTHWAGQQLSSASSTNFQPPCFIQCSAEWAGEVRTAPGSTHGLSQGAQPALLAMAQGIIWEIISEGRNSDSVNDISEFPDNVAYFLL